MPAHPVALKLIQAAGVPLAAPSANRFTELSPTTAEHVRAGLGSEVDLILDGGPCQIGIESTVLSLADATPKLLRLGGISRMQLEAVAGPIDFIHETPSGAHAAPGMHRRHYSPRTHLCLVENGKVPSTGPGTYLRHNNAPDRTDIVIRQMPLSPDHYAAQLYEALHQADALKYDWIAVDLPPRTAEWEAVADRLTRAAER
jgi:L-threonylcarbamoyladenylate synthase